VKNAKLFAKYASALRASDCCRRLAKNDGLRPKLMSSLRSLDLIVIAGYFAGVACIALWCWRWQDTTESYFVGRRSIPSWAMGLSVFATIISSITFIAYPGASFQGNWHQLVPGFMALGIFLLMGSTLISFFRHAVGMSAYEYFEKRFGYGARAYSALAFAAGHFSKMGFVLFTTATAVTGLTGWDKYHVIMGVGLVTTLYTLFGGLPAVIWTEVLQGTVKIIGLIIVIGVLFSIMPGGAGAALHLAVQNNKFSLGNWRMDFSDEGSCWVMLLYGGFWYMQKYATDQTLVQRYLAAKSDRDALRGVAFGAVLCVPAWAAFMLIGTFLWAFYALSGEMLPPRLHDAGGRVFSDQVFPYFLSTKVPAGLAGIFLAALFSAAMSTMSSDLNCLSAVLVEDYYCKIRPDASDARRLAAGKIAVGVCGFLAAGIGSFIAWRGNSALALYYAATSIVSAGLAGMFLLAFFSRRANQQGIWIGLAIAWTFTAWATLSGGKEKLVSFGRWNYAWPEVMVGVVAHMIVLVAGYFSSLLFPANASLQTQWSFWGWLEVRRSFRAEQIQPLTVVER
jgi:SSS family solute:Na+ symporter